MIRSKYWIERKLVIWIEFRPLKLKCENKSLLKNRNIINILLEKCKSAYNEKLWVLSNLFKISLRENSMLSLLWNSFLLYKIKMWYVCYKWPNDRTYHYTSPYGLQQREKLVSYRYLYKVLNFNISIQSFLSNSLVQWNVEQLPDVWRLHCVAHVGIIKTEVKLTRICLGIMFYHPFDLYFQQDIIKHLAIS